MTFDELWSRVENISDEAKIQIPAAISAGTKKKLCKKTASEVAQIVTDAIDAVNNGSIESLDSLIKKKL